MKQILSALAIIVVITACSSNPSENTTKSTVLMDTVGLAQFNAFKQQVAMKQLDEVYSGKDASVSRAKSSVIRTDRPRYISPSVNNQSGTITTESGNAAKAKKGWSKAAKGAVIGAGTGAIAGAVINKRNRAVGATIGGVIGGGVGYGIGRSMDKRDGRY